MMYIMVKYIYTFPVYSNQENWSSPTTDENKRSKHRACPVSGRFDGDDCGEHLPSTDMLIAFNM